MGHHHYGSTHFWHFILNANWFPMPSAFSRDPTTTTKKSWHEARLIFKGSHKLFAAQSNVIITVFWNNCRYTIGKIIHSPYPQVCLFYSLLLRFMNYRWKIVSRFEAAFNKFHEFKWNIQCKLSFIFLSRTRTKPPSSSWMQCRLRVIRQWHNFCWFASVHWIWSETHWIHFTLDLKWNNDK